MADPHLALERPAGAAARHLLDRMVSVRPLELRGDRGPGHAGFAACDG